MKLAPVLLLAALPLTACTTPTADPLPPISGVLVRGTNFNGEGGIEINGFRWTSQSDGKGNGLMLRGVQNLATDLSPNPKPDESLHSMLNTSIAQTGTLKIDQVMYGATYDMYFWFMENQRGPQRTMSITLEGETVETEMGNLPYKHWARFGPYPVTLSDGELNITITTTDPTQKAEVMGMLLIKPEQ